MAYGLGRPWRRTADDNYVTARWCYHEDLNIDFFWLAVRCLEKYLKAALLMNGRPVFTYQHDIVRLYAAVKPLAPELLPDMLAKPGDMPPQSLPPRLRAPATTFTERANAS